MLPGKKRNSHVGPVLWLGPAAAAVVVRAALAAVAGLAVIAALPAGGDSVTTRSQLRPGHLRPAHPAPGHDHGGASQLSAAKAASGLPLTVIS
jgi:hypothetical protein